MRYLLLFLFVLISFSISAQVKVDGKLTGRHAEAVNQAEERREQARQLEQQTKARELYNQKYDSVKAVRLDSMKTGQVSKEDSIAISREVLSLADFPPEYRELIRNPVELKEELGSDQADSIALAKATAILDEEARKFMPNELGETRDPLSELTDPVGQENLEAANQGMQAINKPNPNLVKPEEARELFKKVDPEQFQEAEADMQKLKKKYSELPDTRYPEEGTKRNSLGNIPFKQRLYFGGNISLQSTDPLILSTNLQVGYWINKKWLAGMGLTLREQFTAEDSTSLTTGDGHGYSVFTRYDIPKGFFAWAESEWQIDKSLFGSELQESRGWQRAHLLGVGREFKIGIVQMMSMIMYDFNYQNNDLNPRPWVFRIGVQFSKKPG